MQVEGLQDAPAGRLNVVSEVSPSSPCSLKGCNMHFLPIPTALRNTLKDLDDASPANWVDGWR